MNRQFDIRYYFRLRYINYFDILLGLVSLAIGIVTYFAPGYKAPGIYLISLLFTVIGIIPIILFLQYVLFSLNRSIKVNSDSGRIQIMKGSDINNFYINDIETVEIYEFPSDLYKYHLDFRFVKYFTKGGDVFIATGYMTTEFFIPKGISPVIVNKILPFINTRISKQVGAKNDTDILIDMYKSLSDDELLKIIDSETGYRESAKIAAQKILDDRKTAHNKI
jgi:hypothetical protein